MEKAKSYCAAGEKWRENSILTVLTYMKNNRATAYDWANTIQLCIVHPIIRIARLFFMYVKTVSIEFSRHFSLAAQYGFSM